MTRAERVPGSSGEARSAWFWCIADGVEVAVEQPRLPQREHQHRRERLVFVIAPDADPLLTQLAARVDSSAPVDVRLAGGSGATKGIIAESDGRWCLFLPTDVAAADEVSGAALAQDGAIVGLVWRRTHEEGVYDVISCSAIASAYAFILAERAPTRLAYVVRAGELLGGALGFRRLWRRQLALADPTLDPEFAIADLTKSQTTSGRIVGLFALSAAVVLSLAWGLTATATALFVVHAPREAVQVERNVPLVLALALVGGAGLSVATSLRAALRTTLMTMGVGIPAVFIAKSMHGEGGVELDGVIAGALAAGAGSGTACAALWTSPSAQLTNASRTSFERAGIAMLAVLEGGLVLLACSFVGWRLAQWSRFLEVIGPEAVAAGLGAFVALPLVLSFVARRSSRAGPLAGDAESATLVRVGLLVIGSAGAIGSALGGEPVKRLVKGEVPNNSWQTGAAVGVLIGFVLAGFVSLTHSSARRMRLAPGDAALASLFTIVAVLGLLFAAGAFPNVPERRLLMALLIASSLVTFLAFGGQKVVTAARTASSGSASEKSRLDAPPDSSVRGGAESVDAPDDQRTIEDGPDRERRVGG